MFIDIPVVLERNNEITDDAGKPNLYVVMEFCDRDLASLLSRSSFQFSDQQRRAYMKQILKGLAHVHAQNVRHRLYDTYLG
jgi:serine/threonine protein kinase